MLVNARLIYSMLRWICITYVIPIGYVAILLTYRGWFHGDLRLWKIVFIRSGEITHGVSMFIKGWFAVVCILIFLYVIQDIHWNLKRRDNIPEYDSTTL